MANTQQVSAVLGTVASVDLVGTGGYTAFLGPSLWLTNRT